MSSEEWHSFLIGLFEVLCPWPARYRITRQSDFKPFKEHHYYLGGRVAGFLLLLLLLLLFLHLLLPLL